MSPMDTYVPALVQKSNCEVFLYNTSFLGLKQHMLLCIAGNMI